MKWKQTHTEAIPKVHTEVIPEDGKPEVEVGATVAKGEITGILLEMLIDPLIMRL